jgi:hypothetical protein
MLNKLDDDEHSSVQCYLFERRYGGRRVVKLPRAVVGHDDTLRPGLHSFPGCLFPTVFIISNEQDKTIMNIVSTLTQSTELNCSDDDEQWFTDLPSSAVTMPFSRIGRLVMDFSHSTSCARVSGDRMSGFTFQLPTCSCRIGSCLLLAFSDTSAVMRTLAK